MSIKTRNAIGIITGSGPESGLLLWSRILEQARARDLYDGDLDAPEVLMHSNPLLGLSMNLSINEKTVRQQMARSASLLSPHCDFIAVACNTLHMFQDECIIPGGRAQLVSIASLVQKEVGNAKPERVAFLAVSSLVERFEQSPYSPLSGICEVSFPSDQHRFDDAILQIKKSPSTSADILQDLIPNETAKARSDLTILACTELCLYQPMASCNVKTLNTLHLLADKLLNLFSAVRDPRG